MKKFLKLLGVVFVVSIIIAIVGSLIISLTSKKMVCEADNIKITIMYNNKTLTGYKLYTTSDYDYDLDSQREYAEKIGVDKYLDELSTWFSENTNGACRK